MIELDKISDIIHDPSLSLDEIKEQLSQLDAEYEDIVEFITINLGDTRFERRTAKHRGVTRRKL